MPIKRIEKKTLSPDQIEVICKGCPSRADSAYQQLSMPNKTLINAFVTQTLRDRKFYHQADLYQPIDALREYFSSPAQLSILKRTSLTGHQPHMAR